LHAVVNPEQSIVCAAVEQAPAAQAPTGVQPLPPHAPETIASSQLPVDRLQLGVV
jgi:hypothetical protein